MDDASGSGALMDDANMAGQFIGNQFCQWAFFRAVNPSPESRMLHQSFNKRLAKRHVHVQELALGEVQRGAGCVEMAMGSHKTFAMDLATLIVSSLGPRLWRQLVFWGPPPGWPGASPLCALWPHSRVGGGAGAASLWLAFHGMSG